jgi:hypothetical protein
MMLTSVMRCGEATIKKHSTNKINVLSFHIDTFLINNNSRKGIEAAKVIPTKTQFLSGI